MTVEQNHKNTPLPPGAIEFDPQKSDKNIVLESLRLIAPIFDEEGEAEDIERACQRIAEENGIAYP